MSVEDIYAAFEAAVQAGELRGNTPPGLADLLESLGVSSLPLVGGTVSRVGDTAVLKATTTCLKTKWDMQLTGSAPAGTDRALLLLECALPTGAATWTFKAAFGALPESRRPAPADSGGGLIVGPSVLDGLILEQPALRAGNELPLKPARLSGTLPLRGSSSVPGSEILAEYADFLGAKLPVDGTMKFSSLAPPVLALRAYAANVPLKKLADVDVSAVGLTLTTDHLDPLPDPGERTSAVLMFADVKLPTNPGDDVTVSGPLLSGDYVWPLQADFREALGLGQAIKALIAMTNGTKDDFELPPGVAALDLFGLKDVGFGLVPVSSGAPALSYSRIGIQSKEPWDAPVPFLTLEKVGARWTLLFGAGEQTLAGGSLYGTMRFGQKQASSLGAAAPFADRVRRGALPHTGMDDIVVTVELSLPDWGFSAHTEQPFDLPIRDALKVFLGGEGPDIGVDLRVVSLGIDASLLRKEFAAGLEVSGNWAITAGKVVLALTGLELQVFVSQSEVSGGLLGKGEIKVPDGSTIDLLARAEYPVTGVWEFGAVMSGSLDLPRLVYGLMGEQPPDWVRQIQIKLADLGVLFSTAEGRPYRAYGTLSVAVAQELLGMKVGLLLSAEIERRLRTTPAGERLAIALRDTPQVDPDTVLTGKVSGTFTVNRLQISGSVSVTDKERNYTFEVVYRDVALRAATSWVSDPDDATKRWQVITIRLAGTLGNLITYLVSLANPNANFRLDPPWDFLNSIDLTGLELKIDPTQQKVSVEHDLKLDLGFVTIRKVGLSYDRSSGEPVVGIELEARLLGDTEYKPLSWDPVSQAPPQPPGMGKKLFALRYLGLGQHVSPKNLSGYTSIAKVVDAMVAAMRPVSPATGKPPIDPAKLEFDAASQWLFGIDATFMDTVGVKLVMHDPDLYGILLALSGPQASSLAGLSVELLYRKVTDDIGVFHARLQIPDAYRRLQFGAVSVTLGVITVDIFTNGNFKVDLGFPHNRDFTDSFAIEAGIYNGRGGIYFGVLNGATSSRVPRITNGTFSPVLELGVGLSFGVGRTFERGPLKAGVYVNLLVIFEGALAWFNPDDSGRGKELFYWCRGTVGIVGRLYGTVDFKVIRVDIELQISAMATVELEAYKATVIALSLAVRASASVKIFFIRIKFSFSLTFQTSFEIGSTRTPPWRIGAGAAMRRLPGTPVSAAGYRLRFDPDAHVFPDGQARTAYLTLAPGYTIANVPVDWTGQAPPPQTGEPDYRLVVMLVTDNAVPVEAATIAETARPDVSRNPLADTPADASFNRLADGLLRWCLNALGVTTPEVTRAQLIELVEQLALPESEDLGFSWTNIQGFLHNNLHLVVSGTPAGEAPNDVSGTPFPMIPVLQWTATGLPDPADRTRDFATYRQIDATYQAEANAYFAKLDPAPPAEHGIPAPGGPSESMATFVLRDYFRLIARAMAQAAVNLLTAFPHEVKPTDSLASIAGSFPVITTPYEVVPLDTVDSAAAQLGVSAAELLADNPGLPDRLAAAQPGDLLPLTIAVTPQALAIANPDWPVAAGQRITLGTLPVQTAAEQTLQDLAREYGADLTTLLDHLRDLTPLLRPGATVSLPGFVHAGLPVDHTAAVFYLRLGKALPEEVPLADWYEQRIYQLNPEQPLPATIQVPAGYESSQTVSWTMLPGDTVLDVAAYFALSQNVAPDTPYFAWLEAVRQANRPPHPDGVHLPADAAAVILPNDTLRRLRTRLLLDSGQQKFDAYLATADVLVPLVTVEVPGAVGTTGAGLTLLTLAQQYGLGLADLGRRIAEDTGVLATQVTPPFTVPDVPAYQVDDLLAALHNGEGMGGVSGQVARFMLGGMRLPAPVWIGGEYHASGPMTGGYELIGQQVTGPVPPPPGEPEPPVVTITVDKSLPADWLTFAGSAVRDGAIQVDRAEATAAVVSITGAELRANYPATGLVPEIDSPLAPLPLSHDVGRRHTVNQVIRWQTTAPVHLPSPPTGPPTLWPLPADLTARAGTDRSTSSYLLEQTTPQTGPAARYTELGSYAWATMVSFGVRRIPGRAGTVELLGADNADRQRIAQVLDYLRTVPGKPADGAFPTPPPGERLLLTLLWQLPPAPGLTPGLTSTPLVTDKTFIVQTNLSTETRSAPATAAATAGRHFAAIADCERFLTLLWECSVVGGGGYWLQYRGEVPDSVFDQDGLARFTLLVQLGSQSLGPAPDRHLFTFTNVALVGDGVDPASVAVAAHAVDPPELRPVASVDPGQIGFTARFTNPGEDDSPQGRLRRLYGLLGFQLEKTTAFEGSTEGRAVPPKPADGTDELGLLVASEAAEQIWDLTRVVDISRFALRHLPVIPTAPPPQADPYAGIGTDAATQVAVWFGDVFGNRSGTPDRIPVPVRYTDPVIGVGGWPSTTLRYTVEPAGDRADLTVAVELQTVAYQPGAGDPGIVAAAAAARDRDRLVPVYYQLAQPDVHAALLSSLQQSGADPAPLAADIEPLRRYVIGAHALLGSLSTVRSAPARLATLLAQIPATYGVGFDELAAANAETPLDAMLTATTLAVPVSKAFRNGDTIAGLCRGVQPPVVPKDVLEDPDNTVLPLNPGVELGIPPHDMVLTPEPPPRETPPAEALAERAGCTLASLVRANQSTQGLLAPGFVFECNGIEVHVAPDRPASDTTLQRVAEAFQGQGLPFDAVEVVSLNAQRPGMFRWGATLAVDGYLVRSGDSLELNQAGLTPAQLAPLNTETADLFAPGTSVFLTTRPVPVPAGETLGHFAAVNGATPGDLLRHNGSVALSADSPPVVPGMWAWPADPAAVRVPYTIRTGDSLDGIAAHFPGGQLAVGNAGMPGTVAKDVRITVGGQEVTTTAPSSFTEVCELFRPPVDLGALAAAIGPRTDVLAPGALLVCPPGVLPAAPPGLTGLTPSAAALAFGVSPVALLAANAGTPDLLLPGQELAARPEAGAPTERTVAADTLTAVIERFRRRHVSTTMELIVAANPTAFLRPGARVVVPPATARLTVRLGEQTPDGVKWTFPEPVFPVTVALELSREHGLVDPALTESAYRDRTPVPADRSADPGQDNALTLRAFAEQVQQAIPVLRLATAAGGSATDVWAVRFDPDGIDSVRVHPPLDIAGTKQPRTFAIRPLATTLIARQQVHTPGFDVQSGQLTPGETRDYQGIDLEVWAQGFLTDLELVLSAPYVPAAYALARESLDEIIDLKKTLAGAVAQGLDYVLAGEAPDGTADPKRAAAVERLRQELLVSLSRGYATAAVVQYDTSVSSSPKVSARLSGSPVVDPGSAGARAAALSNAKAPLATGDSQISFLLNVPDVAEHAALDLTLDYKVLELEFGIVPEIDGYERSDWLTFVTPVGSGSPAGLDFDLGAPRVPIPLRAYPPLPILVDHRAIVPTTAARLEQALHWNYQVSLQHQSAEQDSVELRVTYNQPARPVAAAQADDLFATLAQYNAVSAPLLGLLAGLTDWDDWEPADPDRRTALRHALASYRTLASAVATAWTAHWTVPTPPPALAVTGSGPAPAVYRYAFALDAEAGWYAKLRLTRTVESGPQPQGWPKIACITPTGRFDLTPDTENCDCADPATCHCYRFPTGEVPAFSLLTFELTFPDVHIAACQNATAAAWVTRNARLLGDGWPQTVPAFVYRTPEAGYAAPIVPFIDITGAIPIDPWRPQPDPLGPMFNTVFDGDDNGRTVAVGVRYEYTLVQATPPVSALLPVLQSTVGAYDRVSTVRVLTERVNRWRRDEDPATQGAALAFRVSLYSSLDPALQRPVLQLRHLSSPLAD